MATFNINAVARRVQYTVGSSNRAGPYNFTFQVNAASELKVYQNDTLLTDSVQYNATVSTTDGTGSITFIDNSGSGGTDYTPAQNDIVTIIGDQPLSRTTVFQVGQANNPTTLETEFDNIVIRQQQLKEITDRSIQLKPTTGRTVTGTGTNGPVFFPELEANKILSVNNAGNALVMTKEIGSFKGNWSASTAYFERDIVKDTSTNNIFIVNTDHTSSGSQPLTSNANSAKYDLLVDAATATSASTTATAQATIATTKAGEAAASASSALSHKNDAETAKTAAEAAKTAAETAKNTAETFLDNFQDQYLGVQSTEPSTDLDGDALTEGDIYFNSNSNKLRIFSGGQFKDAAVDTSSFAQAGFAIAMAVAL